MDSATPSRTGQHHEWVRGEYRIATDPALLDLDLVHEFLASSYWSPGISRERVERAVAGSLPFGLYRDGGGQVGFARVVSDRATFAYLADVFVLPRARGQGLGLWLCETALSHPDLRGLRRWLLATRDAHGLYARLGFESLATPEIFMERPSRR